jgi:hypothetical protein
MLPDETDQGFIDLQIFNCEPRWTIHLHMSHVISAQGDRILQAELRVHSFSGNAIIVISFSPIRSASDSKFSMG